MAAGLGAAQRDAGGEGGAHRHHLYSAGFKTCSACAPVSYSAGISACEKGEQWQRALALLSEMREAKLDPHDIFSYSAGISACGKGAQWQRALALLSEMREERLEPTVISYAPGSARVKKVSSGCGLWRCSATCGRRSWIPTSQLQRWNQRVREGGAVAAGLGAGLRDAGGEAGANRHQLRHRGQLVREGQAHCRGEPRAGRETKLEPTVITTMLVPARARRASSGSGRWRC
ncbi:unnamed protein product [Prorocentrum cordatum]|uniref:Pentacotripeptide-repeat region of PRORP domain-containing protein n=1 Tax=Prorocentrum cordatum TaxID=2364126 RepID=A0ABN9Y248_9DINO|nr:unnamed protein product [Polarella glacialis]